MDGRRRLTQTAPMAHSLVPELFAFENQSRRLAHRWG